MKPSLAQQALDLRVRLGQLTRWTGAKSQEAINLSNSIEAALERLSPQLPAEYGGRCAVVLQVNTYRNIPHAFREEVELYIFKDGDRWKVNDAYLEALLSLVSYSAWVAERNRTYREEIDRGKILAHLNSSGISIEKQSIEDYQSTGWLRAKAPEMQIYHRVLGKSSPKLLSDLFWWTSSTEVLHKVKAAGTCKEDMVAVPRGFCFEDGSDSEANSDKVVELHALGFDVNGETSKEFGTITIQIHVRRALTFPDSFWSSECTKQQAFILHLFSTFMWATMEFIVSASQFHPTTVTIKPSGCWYGASFTEISRIIDHNTLSLPRLESDKIESLVQELQSTGLGTSEEVYRVLIPPLSYFDKLPNEAVADWCNERLIGLESSYHYLAPVGYVDLLEKVQHREVQDRFAKRAAALVVGFLLRVIDDPKYKELSYRDNLYNKRLRELLNTIANKSVLKAVLSLEHIIARQRKQKNYSELRNLLQLESGHSNLALEENTPEEKDLEKDDFSFPNATDVFGWSNSYWDAFKYGVAASGKPSRQGLDLAGQSALHHAYDSTVDLPRTSKLFSYIRRITVRTESSDFLAAKCNKQIPLHRAARAGHPQAVDHLLERGVDSNAADSFGLTALFLAAYHGHSEVVNLLCDKMDHVGLNRTDKDDRNALHYAILNHQEIAAVLGQRQHAADLRRQENPAILERKEDVALALIDKGLDINAVDLHGCTPLWYATSEGMEKVVKHLLTLDGRGLDILTRGKRKTESYLTAEEEAERTGHEEIAKMLKDARKEIERKNAKRGKQGTK